MSAHEDDDGRYDEDDDGRYEERGGHYRLRRWTRRIAGIVATCALLGIAVAAAMMVVDAINGDDEAPQTPAASNARPQSGSPPRGPRLSKRQRAARAAAVAVVRKQGFVPVSLKPWRPDHVLRVLIGRPRGKGTIGRRAFFFAGRRFAGTDTADDSAGIKVLSAGGPRRVTLRYRLYGPDDDRPCCPTGDTADVRYQWTGSELRLLDTMPTAELRTVRR